MRKTPKKVFSNAHLHSNPHARTLSRTPAQAVSSRLTDALREVAFSCSMSLFGTACFRDCEDLAPRSLPFSLRELPYAISIGFRLSDPVMDGLVDRPTRTYQYHYRQVNLLIDHTLLRLLGKLHEFGHEGFPIPSSQIVNWETNTGHLAHKVVASVAGLGWIGRNNLLVSPLYGARVRYGSLFTNGPLRLSAPAAAGVSSCEGAAAGTGLAHYPEREPADGPGAEGGAAGDAAAAAFGPDSLRFECGSCLACVRVCPAAAIGKTRAEFDLEKCHRMLKSFEKSENIGSMICGLCIKACRGHKQT